MKNLLKNLPDHLPEELFETLVNNEKVQIERIVSKGHTSPQDGWYNQDKNEFVLVVKGGASLEFEDGRVESMKPGDWLEIPAHVKHRVSWTTEEEETVWLAVHY